MKGYCGNNDGDETNELVLPLDTNIYGSTEHVYEKFQCNGRAIRGLPFFQCPMVQRRRRSANERKRREINFEDCQQNAEQKCQAIVGKITFELRNFSSQFFY